jgi:hypothetical protein
LYNERITYISGRGQRYFTILPLSLILSQMVGSLQIPGLYESSLPPVGIEKYPLLGDLTCHLSDLSAKHDYINKLTKILTLVPASKRQFPSPDREGGDKKALCLMFKTCDAGINL